MSADNHPQWQLRPLPNNPETERLSLQHDAVIGRDQGCELVVNSNRLSRRHARVQLQGNHLIIEDLDSTNGTRVNGKKVHASALKPGDQVALGTLAYEVELLEPSALKEQPSAPKEQPSAPENEPPPASIADQPEELTASTEAKTAAPGKKGNSTKMLSLGGQPLRLTGLSGPIYGKHFVLHSPPLIIGKNDDCDIVIAEDQSISGHHAELYCEGKNWQIRDLDSTNGVLRNGKPCRQARINPGDLLTLGQVQLRVERLGEDSKPKEKPGSGHWKLVVMLCLLLFNAWLWFQLRPDSGPKLLRAPLQIVANWRQPLNPGIPLNSPVQGQDTLGNHLLAVSDVDGNLYVLDGEDGDRKGRLAIGGNLHNRPLPSNSGWLLANTQGSLQLANGDLQTLSQGHGAFYRDPLPLDINGDDAPETLALSAKKGLIAFDEKGKPVWSSQDANVSRAISFVATDGDDKTLFLAGESGELVALNLSPSGIQSHWRRQTSDQPLELLVSKDERQSLLFAFGSTSVTGYYVDNGNPAWEIPLDEASLSAPTSADLNRDGQGDIIVLNLAGQIRALDGANGKVLWHQTLEHRVMAPPVFGELSGDKIPDLVLVDDLGGLHLLSGKDGMPLMAKQELFQAEVLSAPLLADVDGDGLLNLVIATEDGVLHNFWINRTPPAASQ